jgi:hypothetical protein
LTEEEVKKYVHLIGNLVLVGQGFNSSARNFDLSRKITELRTTGIRTTADLLAKIEESKPSVWSQLEIEDRTRNLAMLAYDELWN